MFNHRSEEEYSISPALLDLLREASGPGPLHILTHDNPDPDALAAGAALARLFNKAWNIPTRLLYSGLIARAENQAMLSVLTLEWTPLERHVESLKMGDVALVDTQPGAGNNSLPTGIIPKIVIDHHHPIRNGLEAIRFVDIRTELGATSSMVYQYLEAAGVDVDSGLATAIFYGIQTDTRALSRGSSETDQEIYFKLLEKIDRKKLIQIEQAGLPRQYFQAFNHGLESSVIHGSVIISYLHDLHRPDFVAEMADLLIRMEGMRAALCMGSHRDRLYISLRTNAEEKDAGLLIQKIIAPFGKAGGHGVMAGGQVELGGRSADEIAQMVQRRFLEVMGEDLSGESLLY